MQVFLGASRRPNLIMNANQNIGRIKEPTVHVERNCYFCSFALSLPLSQKKLQINISAGLYISVLVFTAVTEMRF